MKSSRKKRSARNTQRMREGEESDSFRIRKGGSNASGCSRFGSVLIELAFSKSCVSSNVMFVIFDKSISNVKKNFSENRIAFSL